MGIPMDPPTQPLSHHLIKSIDVKIIGQQRLYMIKLGFDLFKVKMVNLIYSTRFLNTSIKQRRIIISERQTAYLSLSAWLTGTITWYLVFLTAAVSTPANCMGHSLLLLWGPEGQGDYISHTFIFIECAISIDITIYKKPTIIKSYHLGALFKKVVDIYCFSWALWYYSIFFTSV